LYEVPCHERNEKSKSSHYEEWQACEPGRLPILWDQDIQDWKGLKQQRMIKR